MEMEMRASEDIKQGKDITPPLPPLSFSLHDSFLFSHCSCCFSPLPSSPFPPLLSTVTANAADAPTLSYCSSHCSSLDSPIHVSSSELHLLQSLPSSQTSDLRAALRFLSLLHSPPLTSPQPRLSSLLTNRDKIMSSDNPDVVSKIREGAQEMAKARGNSAENDLVLEDAALCLVMTNAVDVQDESGRVLGIAVYDKEFSWINHNCSPNACYRFLVSQPNTVSFEQENPMMRIVPHVSNGAETQEDSDICSNSELRQGIGRYGPRIVVRSIKPINKDEEVTVAYTDLLQPKEISASNLEFLSLNSDYNFHRDEANQKLTDYMDEVITEYLSVGDPESCCKKLENMLTQGLQSEQFETKAGKLQLSFRLHPMHHLALNAYTTLASAYKIRSIDLFALYSDVDRHHRQGFDMSRTSAAYSLLLAGVTHHLFQSESSLIASSANFWASAGESLLTLARSSAWNLFLKPGLSVSKFSLEKHKCSTCTLMNRFEVNSFLNQAQNAGFQNISSNFLDCISNMTRSVWNFLIHDCQSLQIYKDPIDFSWTGKSSNPLDICAQLKRTEKSPCWGTEESNCRREAQGYNDEARMNIFLLGAHCLLYGAYLANICYCENSHLTRHIQNVLYNEEN